MSTIRKVCTKDASEERNIAIDLRGKLEVDELLIGTPTVEEITTSDLSLSNEAVSSSELTIEDDLVPVGQAVQFKVTGGVAGKRYKIRVTVNTNANPAQTLIENIKLRVI